MAVAQGGAMHLPRPIPAPFRFAVLAFLLPACTGGSDAGRVTEPSEVGQALSDSLVGQASIAPIQEVLAQGLYSLPSATPTGAVTLESCQEVENLLSQACGLLGSISGESYCYGQATYFMAHSTPRCAARLQRSGELEEIYAFDLSGTPVNSPSDHCGDGVVDGDEQCDDGNREDWDGCSATCNVEEFQGCEAVIEQYYQDAGIAFVPKNQWDGPRSHLMINSSARPLVTVNQQSCDAAISLGVDVCNELVRQMPFVGSCQPLGRLRGELGTQECDLRFQVYFDSVDPDSGVFTTAMPGILAFTLE